MNGAVLNGQMKNNVQTRVGDSTLNEIDSALNIQTGVFSRDVKNAKTVTGRVMWSPRLGHEFGVSGYWGRYTPQFLPGKNMTAFGVDTLQTWGSFDFEAEYIYTHLGGLQSTVQGLASQIMTQESSADNTATAPGVTTAVSFNPSGMASTKQGYWAEFRYHWRPHWLTNSFFGKYFSDPQLIPIVRVEQAFLNNRIVNATFANGALTNYQTQNNRIDRFTAGLAFRLNPLAVFHLAYEYTQTNKGTPLADVTDFLPTPSSKNSSVMFGAAFGF